MTYELVQFGVGWPRVSGSTQQDIYSGNAFPQVRTIELGAHPYASGVCSAFVPSAGTDERGRDLVSNVVDVPGPPGGVPQPQPPRGMLKVVKGVLVTLATLYVMTGSLAVVIIGATVAVVLVAVYEIARRF